MRTLIHLSDLHFGRINDDLIQPLIDIVTELRPDVVAVSGDLTQRARVVQFQAAQAFLQALPFAQVIVPGNHDVPLYNVYARFLLGLKRYRRHVTSDLEPFYVDPEMAIFGLNTARSLALDGGRVNAAQISRLEERLKGLGDDIVKIIVTHHPFDLPERYPNNVLVRRARMALERLAPQGIDLFLAGHLHVSHVGPTTLRFKTGGRTALFIQAGTATSTRGRGEANAFNLICLRPPDIAVERFTWQPETKRFAPSAIDHFRRASTGWAPCPSGDAGTKESSHPDR